MSPLRRQLTEALDEVTVLRERALRKATVADLLLEKLNQTEAQLTEARRVLKLVEWVNFPNEDWLMTDLCPVCGDGDATRTETGRKDTGHAPDCALAKALGEGG